jgi:WD40 repeat protein
VHGAPITSIAFDPAGKFVATAGGETVRVWDAWSGSQKKEWPQDAPVVATAFDASGDELATVAQDGSVRLWRIEDGTIVDSVSGLPAAVEGGGVATTIIMNARNGTIDIVRAPAAGVPRAWTWNRSAKTFESEQAWQISSRHRLHVRPDGGIEVRGDGDVPLALLPALRKPLAGTVVSPGGYVAAFYANGQVRGVRLPASDPKEFIKYTREKVVPLLDRRELSAEERRRLGLGS